MSEACPISPQQAEAVVDDRIERFGLGAFPRVGVSELADGRWCVRWENLERTVAPMTRDPWCAWLEENVGSLGAGDRETTES